MSTTTIVASGAAAAIQALEAEFKRHANAGDAAALAEAFYAEDAQLLPPNAPLVTGRSAIRAYWEGFLKTGASDLSLETGITYSSGDLMYGVGKYGFTVSGTRQTGKYLVVFQKQSDGSYRAAADAFNSNE
jgi:ketosteroid isomerase-like protein